MFAFLLVICSPVFANEAEQIQAMIAKGDLRKALTLTDRQLASDGKSVTFRFLKGLILTRLDELDRARELFVELTREHPDLPEPYNNLAVIYASQGDFEKARDALKQAISTHPTYATAHENMGDIYAKMASRAYNQALQLDSDNSSAKAKLALVNDLFFVPRNENQDMEVLARAEESAKIAAEEQARAAEHARAAEAARKEAEAAKRELAALKEKQARAEEQKAAELAREKARQAEILLAQSRQAEVARRESEAMAEREAIAEKQAELEARKEARARDRERDRAGVVDTLNGWAAAWSGQDVEAYTGFYGMEFSPPGKLSRQDWKAQRRVRLTKPSFIKVTLSGIEVKMLGDSHAQAVFRQKYESNTYSDEVRKTLILKKVNDNWLITGEHSG